MHIKIVTIAMRMMVTQNFDNGNENIVIVDSFSK